MEANLNSFILFQINHTANKHFDVFHEFLSFIYLWTETLLHTNKDN
jgi:hypothetical protein